MDSVRFGRALGFGARQAVKTLVTAVDAATAANPSGAGPGARTGQVEPPAAAGSAARTEPPRRASSTGQRPSRAAAPPAARALGVQSGLVRGTRRFGREVWNPFLRLSGVLWLEVMGVFFGIFALFALIGIFRLRSEWHWSAASHRSLLSALIMLAVFGYFCISSFVRAHRRERRR